MSDAPQPEIRADLLDDFYSEADEHLDNMRTQLTLLESSASEPATVRAGLESIYHSIHSLKGISAMVGLGVAEEVAHVTEDFLRPFTRSKRAPSAADVDILMMATHGLEEIVGSHRLRRPLPPTTILLAKIAGATSAASETSSSSSASAAKGGDSVGALKARGLSPWRGLFRPSRELDQRGININSVRARLAALGPIMKATPVIQPGVGIAFEFLLGLRESPENLAQWAADGVEFQEAQAEPSGAREEPSAAPAPAEVQRAGDSSLSIAPSHMVRVDLSRLDDLMRITGELVIHRSRLEERINRLSKVDELKEVNQSLARSLRQLRAAITRVRVVPVAEIFTRMPFVVRDLARESGRKARLLLEGQQTELDKFLVERLKEPLLHLVRNAFSHGVESPQERVGAGKPAEATILLRARTAGEFVFIDIRDDGRGIDAARVAKKAAEVGVPVPAILDEAALLQILCAPGFSTREEADRASGRGVGMSVVYDTVRALGGTVTLETKPGVGTTFTLRLPLTLTITETIIVSAAGQTCAVPQGYIDEIVEASEAEVRSIQQAEVISYRGGLLPLLRLRSLFRAPRAERANFSVLVLSSERGSTGLAVDRVHTQREIVVRPMSDPLIQVPGISGATELGDGKPVLILDPIAITNGVVRPRTPAPADPATIT